MNRRAVRVLVRVLALAFIAAGCVPRDAERYVGRKLPPPSVLPIVYHSRGTYFRGKDGRSRVIIELPAGGVSPDGQFAGNVLMERDTGKPYWLFRVYGPDGRVIRDVKLPYAGWVTEVRMSDDGSAVLVLIKSIGDFVREGTLHPGEPAHWKYQIPDVRAYLVTTTGEVKGVDLPGHVTEFYSIGPSVWTCLSQTEKSLTLFVFDGDKPRWSKEFPLSALNRDRPGDLDLRTLGRSKHGDAVTGLGLELSPEESHYFDMDGNPVEKPGGPAR